MPQQLIYTSAPRGVVAGRSGHCTVARSSTMRDALALQLEKLSYYQHLSLAGGKERPIYCCRVIDIRSSRFHVLSRIQDAGLDFTGRTNFLAHHLVFTPEEVRQMPLPPLILSRWSGWVKMWSQEPQLFEHEDWSSLGKISAASGVPAANWKKLTGDAINAYGLLELRVGSTVRVDNHAEEQILALFGESLELLELRDPRRDFRATAWQYTFTTSLQEQDNPADFRWRCLHSDNPASNRSAGPDCRPISEVRAARVTNEEAVFARSGRQPPRFVVQPQNIGGVEGEVARLRARAEGVPPPAYQWYVVDRAGNGQLIANANEAELTIQNPPLGLTRYVVRATNSLGGVTSEVATLSVEGKRRGAQASPVGGASGARILAKPSTPAYVKSADQIERQRKQLELQGAEAQFLKRQRRRNLIWTCAISFVVVALGMCFVWQWRHGKPAAEMPSPSISGVTNNSLPEPQIKPQAPVTNPPALASEPAESSSSAQPGSPPATNPASPSSPESPKIPPQPPKGEAGAEKPKVDFKQAAPWMNPGNTNAIKK